MRSPIKRRAQPLLPNLASALAAAVGAALLGAFLLLGLRPEPPAAAPKSTAVSLDGKPLAGVTVVLDPGHGGADPGTVAGRLSEATLTYRTASELSAALQDAGARVVCTVRSRCLDPQLAAAEPPPLPPDDAVLAATGEPLRARHSPRPLWQRAAVARAVWNKSARSDPNAARNVFFLSLHFDASSAPSIRGGVVCIDRRVPAVPAFARALAAQMAVDNLGRTGDFHGIPGLSGRELGVLDPEYNPVPEKALLELATLSDPQDALEAEDPAWRGEVVRRIALAITQTHQAPVSP